MSRSHKRHREVPPSWQNRAADAARKVDAALPGLGPVPQHWAEVRPQANAKAIVTLASAVLVVAGAALVFSNQSATSVPPSSIERPGADAGALPRAESTVTTQPLPAAAMVQPTSRSTSHNDLNALVPEGGVRPVTPLPGKAPDPRSVHLHQPPRTPPDPTDLATPQSAARAWMKRWCPFDYRTPPDAAWRAAGPAMTEHERLRTDPARDPRYADSWHQIVSAREVGRCSVPRAEVSPEAPRASDRVVVLISTERVVTGPSGPPYIEDQFTVRFVVREADGFWRVDAETTGG